ncbi:GNAT family N-acetyltransferase [Deinococcus cellulosilyticus]|uniref:N-acetyltransferase domain-containing protein n=1 Tax=Deinococcus cellulosilyticus (strain DSM 18568 / NBRC 106333 / KACC 11606 / 5516J-15) TaxID=1223518 RepID=A0A511MXG1_DEIC1|nr:GNAT family N-acetyltransferase [Deinococcus cellulosilyticus]GEM45041.1 hypothetical protein DC3_06760 [Deinococcus cellulosilyticus NBRC 106333 = KACC 11606]
MTLNPTPEKLLQACIDNYVQMFPVGMYHPLVIHDAPDLAYRIGGFPIAALNSVVRSIFDESDATQRIDEVLSIFEQRNLPLNWVITPESRPVDLTERLMEKGFRKGSNLIAMGRSLEGLPALDLPQDFRIEEVRTDRLLDQWARVGQVSYHLPPQAVQVRIRQFTRLLESDLWPVKLYVGFAGDEAVCTSGVRLTPQSAGIYFVGTLPEHTRKGYGHLITLKPLIDARQIGHQMAVLMATPEGLKVYERLGFEQVGVFQMYIRE